MQEKHSRFPKADILLGTFQVVLRGPQASWQMVEHCQLQHALSVRKPGLAGSPLEGFQDLPPPP